MCNKSCWVKLLSYIGKATEIHSHSYRRQAEIFHQDGLVSVGETAKENVLIQEGRTEVPDLRHLLKPM